jgi:amino acid transporter
MRSRAWAWLLALVALVLAVIPMAAMAGLFGGPLSVATANSLWLAAIALTITAFVMSLRQGLRTRTRV